MSLRPMRQRTRWLLAGLTVGGAVLLASWFVTDIDRSEWWAGVLVNVGASALLVAPVYWLTKRLESDVEAVRDETATSVREVRAETATDVAGLTGRVESFERDVDERIGNIADRVAARLAEHRAQEEAELEALANPTSRDDVLNALSRALDREVIATGAGPRVRVDNWRGIYVRPAIHRPAPDDAWDRGPVRVLYVIEAENGDVLHSVPWAPNAGLVDDLVGVTQELSRFSATAFDSGPFFLKLSRMLRLAASHPDLQPIIETCEPGWVITPTHIACHRGTRRRIENERLNSRALVDKIRALEYVDLTAFLNARRIALARLQEEDELMPPF